MKTARWACLTAYGVLALAAAPFSLVIATLSAITGVTLFLMTGEE